MTRSCSPIVALLGIAWWLGPGPAGAPPTPAGAPRRYYRLSRSGQKAVADFRDEWFRFRNSVDEIFRDGGGQR